jgi:hypothetical protein
MHERRKSASEDHVKEDNPSNQQHLTSVRWKKLGFEVQPFPSPNQMNIDQRDA